MSCVAVCPARGALEVKVLRRRRVPAWAVAAAIVTIFAGAIVVARMTGHWQREVPDEMVRYFLALTRR